VCIVLAVQYIQERKLPWGNS